MIVHSYSKNDRKKSVKSFSNTFLECNCGCCILDHLLPLFSLEGIFINFVAKLKIQKMENFCPHAEIHQSKFGIRQNSYERLTNNLTVGMYDHESSRNSLS